MGHKPGTFQLPFLWGCRESQSEIPIDSVFEDACCYEEKKKLVRHVIVSSCWWSHQAGHFPGGGAARGDDPAQCTLRWGIPSTGSSSAVHALLLLTLLLRSEDVKAQDRRQALCGE